MQANFIQHISTVMLEPLINTYMGQKLGMHLSKIDAGKSLVRQLMNRNRAAQGSHETQTYGVVKNILYSLQRKKKMSQQRKACFMVHQSENAKQALEMIKFQDLSSDDLELLSGKLNEISKQSWKRGLRSNLGNGNGLPWPTSKI